MNFSADKFARLLSVGVHHISLYESKNIDYVQDELGYLLGRKGGSSVEYWRKGHLPSKLMDVELLARTIVKRGKQDQDWLEQFLQSAGHPAPQSIIQELFQSALQTPCLTSAFGHEPCSLDRLPLETIPNLAPLPMGSLMPYSRNPLFVGRKKELSRLASLLQSNQNSTLHQVNTVIVTGVGGGGKTQFVSEFVHRYGQYFAGGVFWLSFAEPDAVPVEIAACGCDGALELRPDFGSRSLHDQVRLVTAAWHGSIQRLLIFDECEDPHLLARWRPVSGGCHVLATSRRGRWDLTLGVNLLPLGVLDRAESLLLLHKYCPEAEDPVLEALAEELGDLPLALELAGSYLYQHQRSVTPAKYVEELRNVGILHHPSLQGGGISPTQHCQDIKNTFALSYTQLQADNEVDRLALELLQKAANAVLDQSRLSCLPVSTLLHGDGLKNLVQWERAMARLIELGLIQHEQDDYFYIQRLIAKFVQEIQ